MWSQIPTMSRYYRCYQDTLEKISNVNLRTFTLKTWQQFILVPCYIISVRYMSHQWLPKTSMDHIHYWIEGPSITCRYQKTPGQALLFCQRPYSQLICHVSFPRVHSYCQKFHSFINPKAFQCHLKNAFIRLTVLYCSSTSHLYQYYYYSIIVTEDFILYR